MLGAGWTAAKLEPSAEGIATASSLDGEGKGGVSNQAWKARAESSGMFALHLQKGVKREAAGTWKPAGRVSQEASSAQVVSLKCKPCSIAE